MPENGQEIVHNAPPINTTVQPGMSREEVDRLIAQARREEKEKLYPDLESARKKAAKLEQEKTDLEAAIALAEEGKKGTKKMETRLAEVEEQLSNLPTRFSKIMDDTLDGLKRDGEAARQRDLLTATRDRLLASSTEVIPELVSGNTPEELQASFEKSKQTYKDIYGKAAEKTRSELEGSIRGALPQPVSATGANNNAGGQPNEGAQGGLDDWRQMAPAEWEQKKKAIKEEAFRKAGLSMKQGR
jgi:exonuclease VII small subunit